MGFSSELVITAFPSDFCSSPPVTADLENFLLSSTGSVAAGRTSAAPSLELLSAANDRH